VLICLFAFPMVYCLLRGKASLGGWTQHPRFAAVLDRFVRSVGILSWLVYPSVSMTVLESFDCNDYGADGSWLVVDHRVDCAGDEYSNILIWAIVCVVIYAVGIPVWIITMLSKYGVWRMADAKQHQARFDEALALRERQLETRMRVALSNSVGWNPDRQHFERRVRSLMSDIDGGRVLNGNGIRKLLSRVARIEEDEIPVSEVQALVDKYDTDMNGMSFEEIVLMLFDIVREHCLITGHERIDSLTIFQLRSLCEHKWSMKIPDYHTVDLVRLKLGQPGTAEHAKRSRIVLRQVGRGEAAWRVASNEGLMELGAEAEAFSRPEQRGEREELERRLRSKCVELQENGIISLPHLQWDESGSDEERVAIRRLGFFFLSYGAEVWWFESVVMLYKLFMSALIIFCFKASASQVGLGFLVTLCFLLLIMLYKPMADRALLQLQAIASFVMCLNLFFGVMIITDSLDSSVRTAIPYILVAINLFVIIVPGAQLALNRVVASSKMRRLTSKFDKTGDVPEEERRVHIEPDEDGEDGAETGADQPSYRVFGAGVGDAGMPRNGSDSGDSVSSDLVFTTGLPGEAFQDTGVVTLHITRNASSNGGHNPGESIIFT